MIYLSGCNFDGDANASTAEIIRTNPREPFMLIADSNGMLLLDRLGVSDHHHNFES